MKSIKKGGGGGTAGRSQRTCLEVNRYIKDKKKGGTELPNGPQGSRKKNATKMGGGGIWFREKGRA